MFPWHTLCARDWRHKEKQNVDLPFRCFQSGIILNTDTYNHVIEKSHDLALVNVERTQRRNCPSRVLGWIWALRSQALKGGHRTGLSERGNSSAKARRMKMYDVPGHPKKLMQQNCRRGNVGSDEEAKSSWAWHPLQRNLDSVMEVRGVGKGFKAEGNIRCAF